MNCRRFCFALLFGLTLSFLPFVPASAQEQATVATALPDPLTPEAVQALVSRMSDSEVRDLLLQELDARAKLKVAEPKPETSLIDTVTQVFDTASGQVVGAMMSAPARVTSFGAIMSSYFATLGSSGTLRLIAALVLALVGGLVIDRLYARRLAARTVAVETIPPGTLTFPHSLPLLARRLLRDAGGALLALLVGSIVLRLMLPEREFRVGMTVALWLAFFPRLAWIVLRFLLAPQRADLRLVSTDDWTARVLARNLLGLTIVIGAIQTIVQVAEEIGTGTEKIGVGVWFNIVIFIWLAVIAVVCRTGLRSIVRGGETKLTRLEERVVRAYPVYAVIVIVATFIAGSIAAVIGKQDVIREGRHFVSLAMFLVAPMLGTLIRSTVQLLVPPLTGTGAIALEAYAARSRSYINIARVLLVAGFVIIVAGLWDITIFGDDSGGPVSGQLAEALLIVIAGYIVLEITSILINRTLADERSEDVEATEEEADEGPPRGGRVSRLGTILPPLHWALNAAIIAITALMALGHLGVNVTALLAGAGVAGIAIGFGAQKLVADVVSGMFFLIDDAFRLNEYIDAGGVEGTVEKIALRSILLRGSSGALHCLPYSGINSITNLGRDWGTMKQVFTVPFDTDIEKVRKIFKKIGQDLYENPDFKEAFIQPFKYKGVSQVNDVGIVVRGKFMFKPELTKQFLIQREIFKRVNADFAAAGIQFARREVRVNVDTHGAPLSDAAATTIAANAAASVDAAQTVADAAARAAKP